MKTLSVVLLFCVPLICNAETVDYTFTVINAPLSGANFSWTVEHDGFIESPPQPVFVNRQCVEYCTDENLFTSFAAVSEPSNGQGCDITGVELVPDETIFTHFASLCPYQGAIGGQLPDVGVLGTFTWQWLNPNDTWNYDTLQITDPSPVETPEPASLQLLFCGLVGLIVEFKRRRHDATSIV